MGFSNSYQTLVNVIYFISRFASRIGFCTLFLMMAIIVIDVILRFLFNKPVQGSYEIVQLMMVCTVSLGISYTGLDKGHVAVGFLISKFSERKQAIINSFNYLVSVILFFFISWKSFVQVSVMKESETTTAMLEWPIYPFVIVLGCCTALLGLVFLTHFIESVSKGIKK